MPAKHFKQKIFRLFSTRFLIRHNLRKFVASSLANQEFGVVLDIGAGKSPYRSLVKCRQYICLDIEDRGGCEQVIIADANETWPVASNSIDLILATEVLEHIKKPASFLQEAQRVLKPGGCLVLTTPFVWPLHEAPNDYFRYTKFGLDFLLKQAGLSRIKIIPSNGYLYSMCQLAVVNLRAKVFLPLVFFLNSLALLFHKFEKNKEFYLSNFVIAEKK